MSTSKPPRRSPPSSFSGKSWNCGRVAAPAPPFAAPPTGQPGPPITRQQRGGLEHISLETPDINVAHKELISRGLPDDPRRKPILGIDRHWLLNVLDPDGTRTEFMESRTVAAETKP